MIARQSQYFGARRGLTFLVALVLSVPCGRLPAAEFVRKATWEETEKANPASVKTVSPARWLYSPTTVVGDIRFWFMGGPPEFLPSYFRQDPLPKGWEWIKPDQNGMFDRRMADASGSSQGFVKEMVYTEYESQHDGWAIISYGCKDGWRLEWNGKHMYYMKWRVGPYYAHTYRDAVRIRRGANAIFFNLMRKGGKGQFQFAMRVLDARPDLLHFLMESFPDDLDHVGGAAEELLAQFYEFDFARQDELERQHIEKLYKFLHAKITAGKYNEQMLSVFVNLCVRYRFVENGEMDLVKQHLFSRKGLGPRLVVSTIAYGKFAGSDASVPKCIDYLKSQKKVEFSWARVFYETCIDFRMYDEGVEALSVLAQRTEEGDDKAVLLTWVADLYDRKGAYVKAREAFEAVTKYEDKVQSLLLRSPTRRFDELTILTRSGAAMLNEAMGAKEAIGIAKNLVSAGKVEEAAETLVAKIDAVRDMVVPVSDSIAKDSFTFFMDEIGNMPKDFRDQVDKLFRWKAEETLASGSDRLDNLRRSWGMLQGKGTVNELAVTEAGRLLDSGSMGLAKSWYRAAWLAERKPQTAAELAFAASASGDGVLLAYLQKSLAPGERNEVVRLAGKSVKLGAYVDYLSKAVSSGPTDAAVALQPFEYGWQSGLDFVPRIPSPDHRARPNATTPIRIMPCLHGDKLIMYTGTELEAFNVKTGKRLWSTRTTIKQENRASGRRELPAFVPVVHGDTVFFRVPQWVSTRGQWGASNFKMCAIDVDNGRIRWSSDVLLSNPAGGEAMLYMNTSGVVGEDPTIHATAVDPLTGKEIWSRVLATDTVIGRDDKGGGEVAPPLITPAGVVFSTGLGVVAMLHPLTGDILWLRRYPRPPFNELVKSYHVSPAQYVSGLVVLTPRETHLAYALDPKTGKSVWEVSTSRSPYAAGVWDGKIVMMGEAIRLLDGATGAEVAKTSINPHYFPFTRIYGDTLVSCGLGDAVSYDLRTLKRTAAPLNMDKGEHFLHVLGKYGVTVGEDTFTVYGQARTDFEQLASDRTFEKMMLAMKKGNVPPDLAGAAAPTAASGASPEDIATFRVLMATALEKAGHGDKAKSHAALLLKESSKLGLLNLRQNHWVRTSQPAHRVLGDGKELGGVVTEPEAPANSRPMPMWVKESNISGISVPPVNRGVLLTWSGGQVEMLNMAGFGETVWRRQLSHPVSQVTWYDDIVILRLEEGPLTALDLYAGDLLWTKAQSTADSAVPTLYFTQYSGGMLMWTQSGWGMTGMDPRTGKDLWHVEVPERRIPESVHGNGTNLYVIASKLFQSERGPQTRGDWRVYEIDAARKRFTRAVPIGSGAVPTRIEGDFIVMSESDGSVASVRDLKTGKRVWKDAFDMPVTVRTLPGPDGRRSLLGIIDARSGEMRKVVSAETGQVLADARNRKLYFSNGAPYVVDPRKNNLIKLMAASVSKKKPGRIEKSDDDDTIDDLGGDISADLGLKASKSTKADAGLELVEWEYPLPRGSELAWHWEKDHLLTVETAVGVADFYKLDLKTGKPGRRIPLAYPGDAAAAVRWLYDGRYCTVLTGRGLYCFRLVDEAGLRDFVKDRASEAGKVVAPSDRPSAFRAAKLSAQALAVSGTVFKPGPRSTLRLDKATQWVPGEESGGGWTGQDDLSANIQVVRKGGESLEFRIEVKDDYWEPYEGNHGDYLNVDIGGLSFAVGMSESGKAVCRRRQPNPELPPLPVHSVRTRMSSFDTVEYTFVVGSWDEPPVEGQPRAVRSKNRSYLNFRVAVVDSDGAGTEGQLEWGLGHGLLSLTP